MGFPLEGSLWSCAGCGEMIPANENVRYCDACVKAHKEDLDAAPSPRDGGSAFPVHGAYADNQDNGMSLRDYFAAHAPAIPDWFLYSEPNAPQGPKRPDGMTDFDIRWGAELAAEDCPGPRLDELGMTVERRDAILAYSKTYGEYLRARAAYTTRKNMNRLTAWRFAYADSMLSKRGNSR